MQLAALVYEKGFAIDELLARISAALRDEGFRLAGTIQQNSDVALSPVLCTEMRVLDLESGTGYAISQDLGPQAQGCRLDTRGLAEIAVLLGRISGADADLVVLNKFGRAESEGHGLRGVFAHAIEAGLPVLTAVRPPYDEAWREFHGGLAMNLLPDREVALAWCRQAVLGARCKYRTGAPVK